jgi:RNA methyltransferase, TrmH family
VTAAPWVGGAGAARRLLRPAGRRAAGAFLIEGARGVREARDAGLLRHVFATAAAAQQQAELLDGVGTTVVAERTLAGLADTVHPQGIVGVADLRERSLAEALGDRPRLVAVLVDTGDPGNAGTVLRTAGAAGADAVVFATGPDGGGVDPYGGKCVRASAGSVFHVPFAADVALDESVQALRSRGVSVLATDADAATALDDAADAGRLSGPTAWIFGNEARGLPPDVLAGADLSVRVPVHGRAESLNLAAAAAVCLYASARAQQRR